MKQKAKWALTIIACALIILAGVFYSQSLKYDFKLLNGQQYKHEELLGQVVIVNYFAQWCAPCLREIPQLNAFYAQSPSSVKLFAISYDNLSEQKLLEIKTKYNIKFPLISELNTPFAFEKPSYLPATFVIKPNGELAGQLLGEQSVETLTSAITAL